jgi:hypothetical protein
MSRVVVVRLRAALIAAAGLGLGLGVLGACMSTGLPVATASDAARAQVGLAELQRGRSLVAIKCGGCHKAPLPNEQPAANWPGELDAMTVRSHIDAEQRRLIESYLVTMATRPVTASR